MDGTVSQRCKEKAVITTTFCHQKRRQNSALSFIISGFISLIFDLLNNRYACLILAVIRKGALKKGALKKAL